MAFLLRRKAEVENLPYVFLVLSYGNEVFQVALPSPERESSSSAERLTLPGFPVPMPADWAACVGPPQISAMDLRGREPVTDAVLEIEISFETMTANDAGD